MIDFDATVLASNFATYGELVDFYPVSGPPQLAMVGIPNESNTEMRFEDGNEVSTSKPTIGFRQSNFVVQQPAQNDLVAFRGRTWRIQDVDADGEGHLNLTIMLADDNQPTTAPLPPQAPPIVL